MRRVFRRPDQGKLCEEFLRKIASQEVDQLGDTSTLADPSVVDQLIEKELLYEKIIEWIIRFYVGGLPEHKHFGEVIAHFG